MLRYFSFFLLVASLDLLAMAGVATGDEAAEKLGLPAQFRRLLPLHQRMSKPRPGDWLAEHEEPGQTYLQYVRDEPVVVAHDRRTIFVQPLGDFQPAERKLVDLAAEFLGLYYGLPITKREPQSLADLPASARRVKWETEQLLSTHLLYEVLKPQLPRDGAVLIGFTRSDLWPGPGWNFVFGQASLSDRVGVWSIHRLGEPAKSDEAFRLALRRTARLAAHETGHMFSMAHCTLYNCAMAGVNHLAESDRRPLEVCPHCLAKLWYATKVDPGKRFGELAAFCHRNGLADDETFYRRALETWKKR